jgi:PAS domain S-box-containing protein
MLVRAVTDYAIYMLDLDGTVLSWNAGAERLKGYAESEILGQLIKAIARGRAWFEELATGHARSLQELAKRDDISRRHIEIEISAQIARARRLRIYGVGISNYGRTYEEGKKINWLDGLKRHLST